jgi:hypothetical protein
MLPVLLKLTATNDVPTMCAEFADMLGLDEPVPPEVLARACSDDQFARYLLRSRGHSTILAMLMSAPGNAAYREAQPSDSATAPDISNLSLMKKAGKATLKWAASGFRRVDDETLERRLTACQSCPHLTEPPDRLIYQVSLLSRSDPRVCAACGCVASRKAAFPAEACPVEDPARPGWTMWQEMISQESVGASV